MPVSTCVQCTKVYREVKMPWWFLSQMSMVLTLEKGALYPRSDICLFTGI